MVPSVSRSRAIATSFLLALPVSATAQEELDVSLSLRFQDDIGWETVQPGERVRLYLETSAPAYVAIFEISPRFELVLRHPFGLDHESHVASGVVHRPSTAPFGGVRWVAPWRTGNGFGHLIAVASRDPLDLAALDALGPLARWNSVHYSVRQQSFHVGNVIDQLVAAVAGEDAAVSVVSYAVASPVSRR